MPVRRQQKKQMLHFRFPCAPIVGEGEDDPHAPLGHLRHEEVHPAHEPLVVDVRADLHRVGRVHAEGPRADEAIARGLRSVQEGADCGAAEGRRSTNITQRVLSAGSADRKGGTTDGCAW